MVSKKFKFISYKTQSLSKKNIQEICLLKIDGWKYSFKDQKRWFKKNIFRNDIHNCLFIEDCLVGYTCLRKRKYYFIKKKMDYLLFDTIIIKKSFRGLNLGKKLMRFNNRIIKKNKLPSFLITTKKNLNFYRNSKWKINFKNFTFTNHKVKKNKILMNLNIDKILLKQPKIFLST